MATHKNAITTWGEIQVITSPQAYNIAGNYTPVKYTFQLVRTATSFGGYWSNNASTAKLSINGTAITVPNFTYDFRTNYTKVLATGTINIPHEPNGEKTFAITASTTTDASLPNGSLSASEKLATIPRTSTFTIPSSFNVGSAFTVSITRASSSFTHELSLWDGSTSIYWHSELVATSGSINVEANTLIARMSGVKSKVFTVRVATFNGSTYIGLQTKTITANIPVCTFTIPSSFNVGSAFTASISRVSSSLTHRIELVDGSTSLNMTDETTSINISSTVPADTLIGRMSGVKSKAFTVRLHTYNDGVWIAMTTKTITASIPISTFTAPDSFTMGNAFNVSISRVGSLTHVIELIDGSTWLYGSGITAETSDSINIPLSTLAARSPDSMSKVFKLAVSTFNGSTNLGFISKNITAYVPADLKPTIGAVTVSENESSVASLVGAYVQTRSKLNLAITGASGIYGSTIRSFNITGVGHNANSSSTVTGLLSVSGNQTITGTVIDSRGQTFEKSIVVNILPYTPPTLSDLSFRRTLPDKTEAPLGDNVTVRASVKVYSLIVNGVQKNSIKYQVQSAQSGGSFADKANTTSTDLTKSYSDVWVGYSVDHSYNFRVRAGDVFGFGGWSVGVVPTGIVTQQWGSKTTSFGKMIDNTSYNVQVGTGGIQSDGDIVFGEHLLGSMKSIINDGFLSYEHTYDANNITRSGIYSVTPDTQNAPADWGLIIAFHRVYSHHAQQMIDNIGNSWTRMRWGDNWSPWQKTTPTDYVIESGSNSDGSWTKFPDGTMICHRGDLPFSANAGGSTNESDWTFPQPFVNSNVSVNFGISGNNAHWGSAADFTRVASWGTNNNLSTNAKARLVVRATSTFASGVFRATGLVAVGRWK